MEQEYYNSEGFIPGHGGYRNLITYQKNHFLQEGGLRERMTRARIESRKKQ